MRVKKERTYSMRTGLNINLKYRLLGSFSVRLVFLRCRRICWPIVAAVAVVVSHFDVNLTNGVVVFMRTYVSLCFRFALPLSCSHRLHFQTKCIRARVCVCVCINSVEVCSSVGCVICSLICLSDEWWLLVVDRLS